MNFKVDFENIMWNIVCFLGVYILMFEPKFRLWDRVIGREVGGLQTHLEGTISNPTLYIEDFRATIGVAGLFSRSTNLKFEELDEYIYDFFKDGNESLTVVLLRDNGEDRYGNKKESTPITIGTFYKNGVLEYRTWEYWSKDGGTYERWREIEYE